MTGAGIDPCAALQCVLELAPGETREVVVLLGAGDSEAAARDALAALPRRRAGARRGATGPWASGPIGCRVITVRTPEPTFDAMLNRWTLYQALACRMWARSALYQSSGAYGFRDQLQDVMALVYAEPALAREHILRAAGAPVRRRRRAALVAPAERPRRPHPVLRRPRLAAVRGRPLRPHDRRRIRARRARAVPHHARARPGRARGLRPARRSPTSTPASTSTASARSGARAPRARTACRSSASATGTTA